MRESERERERKRKGDGESEGGKERKKAIVRGERERKKVIQSYLIPIRYYYIK